MSDEQGTREVRAGGASPLNFNELAELAELLARFHATLWLPPEDQEAVEAASRAANRELFRIAGQPRAVVVVPIVDGPCGDLCTLHGSSLDYCAAHGCQAGAA